jgi:hypothetical protein
MRAGQRLRRGPARVDAPDLVVPGTGCMSVCVAIIVGLWTGEYRTSVGAEHRLAIEICQASVIRASPRLDEGQARPAPGCLRSQPSRGDVLAPALLTRSDPILSLHHIRKGLDLPLTGTRALRIEPAAAGDGRCAGSGA